MKLIILFLLFAFVCQADQYLMLRNKGLYTDYNEFSNDTPEGAMTVANNIVIDSNNIAEPRRGFEDIYPFTTTTDRASNIFEFKDKIFVHTNTNKIRYYDSGWNEFTGDFNVADETLGRLKHAKSRQNLYICTDDGVKKLDTLSNQFTSAGIPKALDIDGELTSVSSGFFTNDNQIAYRTLWGIKDGNGNLIVGSPSQRLTLTNTTGSAEDVNLTITIPDGITTSYFYQIYRSPLSGASTVSPSDELQLVYEGNPDSTDISNKYLTVSDNTPDELRGAILYTSPSQGGILLSNDQPPFAKDIAEFRNNMFYANTKTRHSKILTLLAAGSSGLTVDDTITIAGMTFTAKSTESAQAGEFKVYTTGSTSQNIQDTALSLVRVVNRISTNSTIYGYYLSGPGELPGKMNFERRSVSSGQFSLLSSSGTSFSPQLPASGDTVLSVNDEYKNRLYFSKTSEQEAVPATYFQSVGTAGAAILRIIPLRESLLIFKEDGVFRLTGDSPSNFFIDNLDSTTNLLAPDTAVALNNQVYMFADQGIVTVSDTGVSIISDPIEDDIRNIIATSQSDIRKYNFGVGYDTDKKYILYSITNAGDTSGTQAYVYNFITRTWVKWTPSKQSGFVFSVDDKLYFGDSDSNKISKERKNLNATDFVDESFDVTISSVNGQTITLSSASGIDIGDLLWQSSTLYSVIDSVNVATGVVTIATNRTFSTGAAEVFNAIDCDIEYNPQSVKNPGLNKQFREVNVIFKEKNFSLGKIGFTTNIKPTPKYVDVTGDADGLLWGLFGWGSVTWGGYIAPSGIRTYVTPDRQRATWTKIRIKVKSGYGQFRLNGYSLVYNLIGEKTYE